MYARVATFEGGDNQAIAQGLQEKLVPQVRQLEGFRGGYWTTCGDKRAGVTFFESKKALEDSREGADKLRQQMVEALGIAPAEFEEFEVIQTTGEKIHREAQVLRLVQIQADPQRVEDAKQMIAEKAIPALKQVDGFLGGVWLADPLGKGVTVLLFENQAKLDAKSDELNQLRDRMLQQIDGKTVSVDDHEIVARAETPVVAHI